MKKVSNLILALGLFFLAYAVFSNYYGEQGVALRCIRSRALFAGGNSLLLLSLITATKDFCKK